VTLELGGGKKPANIVVRSMRTWYQAIEGRALCAAIFNQGQCCLRAGGRGCTSKRRFNDEFVEKERGAREEAQPSAIPSTRTPEQGPQVDQDQFNKVMSYIDAGKKEKGQAG